LAKDHPSLESALRDLESWIKSHAEVNLIQPGTVARDLPQVDTRVLAEALTLLENSGYLRRVYKVLTPAGVMAEGEFEDPTRVPERLPDRFENYFDTSDADIVPAFHLVTR
jgi:hypothetical protein